MRSEQQIKKAMEREYYDKRLAVKVKKALREKRRVILHNGCGVTIAKGFVDHYVALGLLEDCEFGGLGMYRVRSDLKAKEDLTNGGLLFRRIQIDTDETVIIGSYWYQVLKTEAFLFIEGTSSDDGWTFYEALQTAWRANHGVQKKVEHLPWRKAREVFQRSA